MKRRSVPRTGRWPSIRDDARSLLVKGESLTNLGKYPDAIPAFDGVLALDPENERAHKGRGMSLSRLGRYEDAIIELDRALETDTANPELYACKGYSLYRLSRYKEAVESLGKSLKRKAQNPFVLLFRGKAYLRISRWEDAHAMFEKLIGLGQKNATAWYYKGILPVADEPPPGRTFRIRKCDRLRRVLCGRMV